MTELEQIERRLREVMRSKRDAVSRATYVSDVCWLLARMERLEASLKREEQ